MNSTTCLPSSDDAFGPIVQCPDRFDFTLYFEYSFLSIVPAAALLVAAPFRLWSLLCKEKRVDGAVLKHTKLMTFGVLSILQLTLIILWATQYESEPRTSIAAATVSLVTSLTSCALSSLEHSRSLRPSMLLNGYLLLSLIFDAAILRTLWLLSTYPKIRDLFTASFVVKALVLLLEAKEKRKFLMFDGDKRKSPEETSGLYSQGVFWWLNSLIRKGYRQVMEPEDLYPVNEDMRAELLGARFWRAWEASNYKGKHKLVFVTIITFKWSIILTVIPRLLLIAFTICQPLLVARFLSYLQDPVLRQNADVGWALVGAYAIVYLGIALTSAFYWHRNYKTIAMLRASLVTVVFQKTTEISITALDNSAAVTLMSTDVDRILRGLQGTHELWANIIQIGIATYLLQIQIGLACLAPIVVALVTTVVMGWLSSKTGTRQTLWVTEIHKRVGITTTMLGQMKGVKMSGLSTKLSDMIQNLRVLEIVAAKSFRMLQVWGSTIAYVPLMASPVLSFAIFIAISAKSGETLDVSRLFTALSILLLLTQPLFTTFAGFMELVSAVGCFERIETFLSADSRADHRLLLEDRQVSPDSPHVATSVMCDDELAGIELVDFHSKNRQQSSQNHGGVITIMEGSFGWKKDSEPVLHNISLSVAKSSLTMVIGPVASGKSTLLKAIIGETPSFKGFIYVSTKEVAWCEQTPWLINASVRRNIIGFDAMDQELYETILQACDLVSDIKTFPNGDETLVGSKGITLSGGQKQRIAIARAIYSRKLVAIFDDVFSGLDQETEKHVFDHVFGQNGIFRRWGTTVIMATHAVNLLPKADHIVTLGTYGTILEQGTFADLRASNGYVHSFCLEQSHESSPNDKIPDAESDVGSEKITKDKLVSSPSSPSQTRQTGDLSIYKYYFQSIGAPLAAIFFFLAGCWGFFNAFPTVWLKWWADANDIEPNQHTGYYIGIYALLQVLALMTNALLVWFSFNVMVVRAGLHLHNTLLKVVINAPVSFFAKTDTGSIATRFSQDIQLIDGQLPLALMCVVSYIGCVLAQVALIASASPYIAICFPGLFMVFYFLQRYYLRTSRQLRYLDLEEKAPVYTQFIETLSGLSTIRAHNWSKSSILQNYDLVNASQKPAYLLYMIQRWLTLVLDLITTVVAIIVVSIAVKTRDDVSIGFTGVSLTQLIGFTSILKMTIAFWGQLETSIGAVCRIRDFEREVESEHGAAEKTKPSVDWPVQGKIEIQNLSVSYSGNTNEKALDNVSLSIEAGQKIGICGRTGSGKSTFVLALFRMIESLSGSITIDHIDISTLPRQELRSRVNGLGQDPLFIHGSIRLNLDPYVSVSDEMAIEALGKVGLLDVVEAKGGLDSDFDQEMLSHGQRQLFCLARAILRKDRGRVVVLDEVTSRVDKRTDELMQRIIREEFNGHTIIAIAHRLNTIVDFDKIVVMENGRVVEFDAPSALFGRPSRFKELWEISGKEKPVTAENNGET